MKAVFTRTLVLLAGIGLVVLFAAVALLVGARAVAGAGAAQSGLLLAVLALGGGFYGGARNLARDEADDAGEIFALHVASRGVASGRHAFMRTHR